VALSSDTQPEQLLDEIEEVGRNEQSMKPSALAGAYALLQCPEVLRRAGPEATDDQRRQAAHDALKAALATLPLRDQLIGEAILAAPEYEGQNVDQRKRSLEETHGISESAFKRRRKTILERIVEHLIRRDDHSDPDSHLTLDDYRKALRAIERVLLDATELAYACRAHQFVRTLDQKLTTTDWPSAFRRADHKTTILNVLYRRHMDLIVSAGHCFDDQPYSVRKNIISNLPPASISDFVRPLARTFDALPFSRSYERVDICRDYFAPVADLHKRRNARGGDQALWAIRFNQIQSTNPDTHLDAAISGYKSITWAAREWFKMRVLASSEFRLRQIGEIVANYYGVQPTSVVYGDVSLFHHLEYYCKQGKLLASALPPNRY
jgi:hypothetical protein